VKYSTFFDEEKWPENGDFSKTSLVPETTCQEFPPKEPLGMVFPSPQQKGHSFLKNGSEHQGFVWKDEKFLYNDKAGQVAGLVRIRGCLSYITFREQHFTWFCALFAEVLNNNPRLRLGAGCRGGAGGI
jgi:hypothetical protein